MQFYSIVFRVKVYYLQIEAQFLKKNVVVLFEIGS